MSLYVDTSALLKRYIDEAESARCESYLLGDPVWVTGRHTAVEVRRNLIRLLDGRALTQAREQFAADWRICNVVELDEVTCEIAADIAETTGARTLDALHLAAATRVGPGVIKLLTFNVRQSEAARQLGFTVLGL